MELLNTVIVAGLAITCVFGGWYMMTNMEEF